MSPRRLVATATFATKQQRSTARFPYPWEAVKWVREMTDAYLDGYEHMGDYVGVVIETKITCEMTDDRPAISDKP
jgi:hypothetical protein